MNTSHTHVFVLALAVGLASSAVHAAVKATPTSSKTAISAINDSMEGAAVEVEATIKSITLPREGSKAPVRINLTDGTGSITLIMWADVFDVVKAQSPVEVGNTVHATAQVSKYRDNLQLQVRGANDIKITGKPAEVRPAEEAAAPAPVEAAGEFTPVGSITTAMMGRDVTVKATISDVRSPREGSKAPFVVTLTQDGNRIPLVFWSDMHDQIKDNVKVGNVVRVKAQVGEHRGTLQIKLRNAADFSVVTAAE